VAHTVVLVSVDGLAAQHVESGLEQGTLPTFERLLKEGAGTFNARTEARVSVTIPNHTSMVTGRPAAEVPDFPPSTSHLVLYNYDPGGTATVHDENSALGYVTSVFDEVHDRGGHTLLFSSKDKFELYRRSYSAPYSRKDPYGLDDGDDKIDDFAVIAESPEMVPRFLEHLSKAVKGNPAGPNFAWLHIRETDSAGHASGWDSAEYTDALLLADRLLADVVEQVSTLERTVLIVTTDHGGTDYGHNDHTDPLVYRIPFLVWGPEVPAGVDLYAVTLGSRTDPGAEAPLDGTALQPIRNGDSGNLALSLLGLPAIDGALHRGLRLERTPQVRPAPCDPH
jgi:predicted AlkP superfamily pyrophosphatase or phosphodiesterase